MSGEVLYLFIKFKLMRYFVCLCFSLLVITSCGVRVEEGPKMSEVLEGMDEGTRVISLEFNEPREFTPKKELQNFEILGLEVRKKQLIVRVQYGGGCKEHPFYAIYLSGDEEPGKIYLQDPETEDYCRALITETVTIDISKLFEAFPDGKEFVINDSEHQFAL